MIEFVTADQITAHLVGDYLIQSHWMATEKTKRSVAAAVHASSYTLPFLLLTGSPLALSIIAGSHFLIDRYRLARWVIWTKNRPWPGGSACDATATGYPADTPAWLAVWLLIISDNTIHLLCNAASLRFLS